MPAKDSARRYQTMADLKVALQDLQEEPGRRRRVHQPALRPRWAWAALLPVLVGAGLFGWRLKRTPENTEPLQATTLTTFPGIEHSPSLSPDGNYVVFTWTGPNRDNQDIYVQQIGSGSPLRLTTDRHEDYNPIWSPDGKQIAFFRGPPTGADGSTKSRVASIPPLDGTERKLADIQSQDFYPFGTFIAWTPDSKSLVVTDSQGEGKPDALFVISVKTGEKRQLKVLKPAFADTSPSVSPDGCWLVYVDRTAWGYGELHLLALAKGRLAAGGTERLTSAALRAEYPVWTPSAKEVVFSSRNSLWRLTVPGGGTPIRIPYVGEQGFTPTISRPR